MNAKELKACLSQGALKKYSDIYPNIEAQTERLIAAVDSFTELFGDDERELCIFSVPGRSEILGNHTDHNRGTVLAGAIDRDIIAVAAKNDDGVINFHSEGYTPNKIIISDTKDPEAFEKYTSSALIAGITHGFTLHGYSVGGFDAYSNTEVLKGSGISSSAAFEVMIGNIMNHLYNGGNIDNQEIAKLAQYSENVFFGKPCGLMDQMACAVGGFVYIDFEDKESPLVEPIDFSLDSAGYALCIINTGGNHADLNEDYASVPREMKAVASALGKDVLRGITEEELTAAIPCLRGKVGDRAILRSLHFLRECERVREGKEALKSGELDKFFSVVRASGASSFQYLQNVYTVINVKEQGLSLALCLADGFLGGEGAMRVHGGGFAGTVQVFLKKEHIGALSTLMNSVFGEGAAMPLNIRPLGACRLL